MIQTIGTLLAFGVAGACAAALWTLLLRIAGMPGELVGRTQNADWNTGRGSMRALALCVLGQSYAALGFTAICVAVASQILHYQPGVIAVPLWAAAYFISVLPASFASKGASRKKVKDTQDMAAAITFLIASLGFWVFFIWPHAMAPWSWLPMTDFLAANPRR